MEVVKNAKGGNGSNGGDNRAESKSSSDDVGRSRGESKSGNTSADIWGKGIAGGMTNSGNNIAQEENRMRAELAAVNESKLEAKSVTAVDPNTALRRAMLVRMKSLTMADEDTCAEFLESSDYNLEGAVQEYYNKM